MKLVDQQKGDAYLHRQDMFVDLITLQPNYERGKNNSRLEEKVI